jgi:hypothetical protein
VHERGQVCANKDKIKRDERCLGRGGQPTLFGVVDGGVRGMQWSRKPEDQDDCALEEERRARRSSHFPCIEHIRLLQGLEDLLSIRAVPLSLTHKRKGIHFQGYERVSRKMKTKY